MKVYLFMFLKYRQTSSVLEKLFVFSMCELHKWCFWSELLIRLSFQDTKSPGGTHHHQELAVYSLNTIASSPPDAATTPPDVRLQTLPDVIGGLTRTADSESFTDYRSALPCDDIGGSMLPYRQLLDSACSTDTDLAMFRDSTGSCGDGDMRAFHSDGIEEEEEEEETEEVFNLNINTDLDIEQIEKD